MTRNRIINNLTAAVAILTAAIAAGAFVISYDALRATGVDNGIPEAKAWLWPLLIDAPLIVFTLALLVAQINRQGVRLWAGLVVVYTVATIAFNLAHAQATWLGWLVATVAPVSLLLTTEALRHLAKGIIERQAVVETLTELSAKRDRLTAELSELDKQQDTKRHELDTLQADIYRLRLDIQQDKQQFVTDNSADLSTARQVKQDQADSRKRQAVSMWTEGMTHADIAAALDVTPRTVKRYLNGHGGTQ